MSSKRGYEVVLYMGKNKPKLDGIAAIIELNPLSAAQEDILDAITKSDLSPADLRARTLLLVDEFADRTIASALYAALVGFAGRRLDFSTGAEPVSAALLHAAGTSAEDQGKPDELLEHVLVGRSAGSLDPTQALSVEDVTRIRFARRVTLEPVGTGVSTSLTQLIVTAAIRVRNGADYFPTYSDSDGTLVDLDALRRAGSEHRRSIRTDFRDAIAPNQPTSERQNRLIAASLLSMEDTLHLLGSTQSPESGFWRCTRPDRHRNGDANPSMRIVDGKIRCFRCDTEPVDPLRLVVDTLNLSPDAAADMLTKNLPGK
jgi:hypothetical protein